MRLLMRSAALSNTRNPLSAGAWDCTASRAHQECARPDCHFREDVVIDAIARRVVEMMSDKVVREIAWEVVPDLAELLIKQQLEKTQ